MRPHTRNALKRAKRNSSLIAADKTLKGEGIKPGKWKKLTNFVSHQAHTLKLLHCFPDPSQGERDLKIIFLDRFKKSEEIRKEDPPGKKEELIKRRAM